MFKYILVISIVFTAAAASAQNDLINKGAIGIVEPQKPQPEESKLLYGPLPYRTLEETIGETYLVLPLPSDTSSRKYGYQALHRENSYKPVPIDSLEGKLLKLIAIENDRQGHFVDSTGDKYTSEIWKTFPNMTPVSDIINARKMFIGKTLWLNINYLKTGDPLQAVKGGFNLPLYSPVVVQDIRAGDFEGAPILFIVKTLKGQVGYKGVSVSGTNSGLFESLQFNSIFFTYDPVKKRNDGACGQITDEYDAFKKTLTYDTPLYDPDSLEHEYNLNFTKVTKKGKTPVYYMALSTTSYSPLINKHGVKLMLKNGKIISKPGELITTRVNRHSEFEVSALVTLTPGDLALLKASKPNYFKLYSEQDNVKDPDMTYLFFQCLLKK